MTDAVMLKQDNSSNTPHPGESHDTALSLMNTPWQSRATWSVQVGGQVCDVSDMQIPTIMIVMPSISFQAHPVYCVFRYIISALES